MKRTPSRLPLLLIAALFLTCGERARAADPTIASTQRLISQVFARNRDTALVVAALRSTKDPAVLRIFDRLTKSESGDIQLYATISTVMITHDSSRLDIDKLLKIADPQLVGSAIATLIDENNISDEQLNKIITEAPEPAHQVMAASELARRGKLQDRAILKKFLAANFKEIVRYYAAVTLLETADTDQHAAALATLAEMTHERDPRQAPIAGLMIVRVRKDKIVPALPWINSVAADPLQEFQLRLAAVATQLALKDPHGPEQLTQMINDEGQQDSPSIINQIKFGLVAFEFADQLQSSQIAGLTKTRASLVRSVAALARQAIDGSDATPALVALLNDGDPILLTWSLAYADRAPVARQRDIYTTIVNLSTIVDDSRERDFENAAAAAQKIAESNYPDRLQVLAHLLGSSNRAVVEATLAGMLRSERSDYAALVLPLWDGLNRNATQESAANYAALILAREGHKEPLAWLSGMVQGGTVQNPGFRVLAGWYYAKLNGQTEELLNQVMASAK